MTTTPNPTAGAAIALLAGRIHRLKAQLAESERAREALREAVREYGWCGYCQGDYDGCELCDKTGLASWSRAALAAENTAEETMTKERCHASRDGECNWKQCPQLRDNEPMRSGRHCPIDNWDEDEDEPAPDQPPEQVEPSDESEAAFRAWWGDPHQHITPLDGFHAGYRAGLAAEAAAHSKDREAWDEYARGADRHRGELRDELERVRAELATRPKDDPEADCTDAAHPAWWRGEKDGVAGACRALESVLTSGASHNYGSPELKALADRIATLRAQARARRVPTREDLAKAIDIAMRDSLVSEDWFDKYIRAADAVLRLFAEAPPVEIDALARVLHDCYFTDEAAPAPTWEHVISGDRYMWRQCARAAMTALGFQDSPRPAVARAADTPAASSEDGPLSAVAPGVEKTGQLQSVTFDNEPPVPLPEVLPVGTRTRYGSIADGAVVLKEGSHYWGWWNKDTDRERCANADQIDWSHYRAQQRAAEPTPAVTCTWAAYAGKSKVRCDQATDHPSGICDLHRKLADSFGRDVFPEPAPWKPTVGERAVLVSSPDEGDADIVGLELEVVAIDPDEPPRDYWVIRTLDGGAITVHRDATWRPASTPEAAWNYSAELRCLEERISKLEAKVGT